MYMKNISLINLQGTKRQRLLSPIRWMSKMRFIKTLPSVNSK